MQKKILTGIASLGMVLGLAVVPAANAKTAYVYGDGGQISASAWNSGSYTLKVEDELGDDRWVQGQYTQTTTGNEVFYLTNQSGYGTVVSKSTAGPIASIRACQSGKGLAPMYCGSWV